MTRAPRIAAVLLACTLVVTACGDDDDDPSTEATAADVTEAPAATEPATAPTTEAPAATEPATTEPATTEAPATTEPATTEAPATSAAPALGTIIDVAAAAGNFTTLLAAVEAAGMTEELATREVTLLAPTDDAFAALGDDAVAALLADPAALANVLQGHVLPAPQDAALIRIFNNVLTINGIEVPVVVDGDTITVGAATIVTPDIAADNGIIHAIDAVLMPPPAG